jgi:hypothetical protein
MPDRRSAANQCDAVIYREKRRTIRAIGSPMQNMIVNKPIVVPTAVMGLRDK